MAVEKGKTLTQQLRDLPTNPLELEEEGRRERREEKKGNLEARGCGRRCGASARSRTCRARRPRCSLL